MIPINRRKSTLTGLLGVLLIFISITITSISLLSYAIISNEFTDHLTEEESRLLRTSNEHMTFLIRNIEDLSDKIYINRALRATLASSPEALNQALMEDQFEMSNNYIDSFFSDYQLLYRWMKYDVYILGTNGFRRRYSSVTSAQTNIYLEDVLETDLYSEILTQNGQPLLIDGKNTSIRSMEDRVIYARLLKDINTNTPLGVFILTFSKQAFNYIYSIMLEDDYALLSLVTNDGQQVWGNLPDGAKLNAVMGADTGSFLYKSPDCKYQMLYSKIPSTDWYAVRSLNLNRLLAFTTHLKWIVVGLCILCTGLVFLFSARVLRRLYRPIDALVSAMGMVELGKSDTSMLDIERNDEIGQLNRGFVNMVARLDASADELQVHQEKKRQAEIQALQAQIRPHFLYNVLTSIRCVIRQGDNDTAQQMIIALVKLLKGSLSSVDEFFTLEQEIDILKSYALIYQIRYANFDIDYCIEDTVQNCLVPRMILQPLVENSIVHGQGDRNGSLSIRIYAYQNNGLLSIDVTDDGIGFSDEARRALLDNDGRLIGKPDSVGLRNVAQRIALSYGEQYGLYLIDPDQPGTRIRLTIPAVWKGGS